MTMTDSPTVTAVLDAKSFTRAIKNVSMFTGPGDRPVLRCVEVTFGDDHVQLVATDSFGLIVEKLSTDVPEQLRGMTVLAHVDELGGVLAMIKATKTPLVALATHPCDQERADMLEVIVNGQTMKCGLPYSGGKYPDWHQVVNDVTGVAQCDGPLGMGLWQLARLSKIVTQQMADSRAKDRLTMDPAEFNIETPTKCVRVAVGDSITVYLMPVRL